MPSEEFVQNFKTSYVEALWRDSHGRYLACSKRIYKYMFSTILFNNYLRLRHTGLYNMLDFLLTSKMKN